MPKKNGRKEHFSEQKYMYGGNKKRKLWNKTFAAAENFHTWEEKKGKRAHIERRRNERLVWIEGGK